jgi:mycothiol system anti-sigma-R factor
VTAQMPDCGPQCQEALEHLEAYLDGELPESELGRIRHHLTACYPCTDRASFEEQVRALVRRDCHDTPPSDLLARIRRRLEDGDLAAPPRG